MWRRAGRGVLAAAGVAVLVLVIAGPASAAPELRLSPASGPPGSEFTISGTGFAPGEIELHWESQSGPLLSTATGPEFTVSATVPDAPPNSHPVMAVVREGGSVSTSSASFQVTTGAEPVDAVEPATTTTVAEPTTTVPQRTSETAVVMPSRSAGGTGTQVSGIDGGLDPAMADTGVDGNAGVVGGTRAGAGGGSTASPTAATGPPGNGSTTSTQPIPAGVPGAPTDPSPAALPGAPPGAAVPVAEGDAAGTALRGTATSQSSGVVRSPALLLVGLGLVFGGGVVLAVRNRARLGGRGPYELG